MRMNPAAVAEVTSVSLAELKMERDQFLMVSLSNYCTRLTAESELLQGQNNSAISKTAAFVQFTYITSPFCLDGHKDSTFCNRLQ